MDLPTYDGSTSASAPTGSATQAPPVLLNIVPLPGEVSFQQGYVGYGDATVQGSLQLKYTGVVPGFASTVICVAIEFSGVESVKGDTAGQVDLIREKQTLWENQSGLDVHMEGTSDGRSSAAGPAGTLDFTFPLTRDLPHCCHIGSGSIVYSLTASIHSTSAATLHLTIPVHVSRASGPEVVPKPDEDDAEIYAAQHPTAVAVYFPNGTSRVRRSQAIELRVRIPPPDSTLVEDKGLKLRSVSAELERRIALRSGSADQGEIQVESALDAPLLVTTISHSGKAAAFSSSRSVFLNIWLQPVPRDSCESITQSTIYHDVKFVVRVTLSVVGKQGDRQDIAVVTQEVNIIPDITPPSTTTEDAEGPRDEAVDSRPAKARRTLSYGGKQRSKYDPELLRAFREDVEYDGYEQASEDASVENAPPNIDADIPPPQLEATTTEEPHSQPVIYDGLQSPTNDEAPPYSTANAPAQAVDLSGSARRHTPQHQDHHNDSSAMPPPPYETQSHIANGLGQEERADFIRQAIREVVQ